MIERLGIGQNRSFSRFNLHSFDGHSDIDDVSLPPLGHRHGNDVMLPSEVVSYHCSDAIGWNGNIRIKVLLREVRDKLWKLFMKYEPARSSVSPLEFGGHATFCEKFDDGAS